MTAAQVVRRSETYTRETSRAYVTFLLPSLIFVPGIVALVHFFGGGSTGTLAAAVLGLAWVVTGFVLLRRGAYWRARGLGLLCPSCDAPFISPTNPPDAHGNCRHCGTSLIDSDETKERALFTRVEFARGQSAVLGFQRRVYGVWMLLLVGVTVAVPLSLILKAWPRSWGSPETWFGLAVIGLVGFGGIVIAILETARRRRALLECPDCRAELVNEMGEAALANGRCPGCGLLIVDDSEAAKPVPRRGVTPPASAVELNARNDRLEYGTRYEYAIVVPLAIAGIVVAEVLLWTRYRLSPTLYAGLLIGCVAMIAILLYANGIWARRARRLGLLCPTCGELLVGGPGNVVTRFVGEHGTCNFCGTILWDVPSKTPT